MADNFEAALAARNQLSEPPIVIGHSMGGLLGQHVAANSSCAALVLLGSSPPGVLWAHPKALPHLFALMPRIVAGQPLRPSDETLRAVVFNALSEAEAEEMAAVIVPDSGKAFRAQVFGTTPRVRRSAVRCPVLVLSGDQDINGSPGIPRRLSKRYHATHRVIAGCDHWIIAPSRTKSVCPVVVDWYASSTRRPRRRPLGRVKPARGAAAFSQPSRLQGPSSSRSCETGRRGTRRSSPGFPS